MQTAKRYPPGLSVELRNSALYRGLVLLFCGLLIATYFIAVPAHSTGIFNDLGSENGQKNPFFYLYSLFLMLSLFAMLIAVRQAWQAPRGRLNFSQGNWQYSASLSLLNESAKIEGTLQLHFDLQFYILARFIPSVFPQSPLPSLKPENQARQKAFWVHLESRQYPRPQWLALRRAVYSQSVADPLNQGVAA